MEKDMTLSIPSTVLLTDWDMVDGLCINRPDESYNGLFGALFNAQGVNVGVTNIYYNVMGYAGSLVGYFHRSQISNTFSSGLIHTQLENGYISSHAQMEDGEMSNSFSFASAKGGYTVEFSNGSTVNSYYRGYINDVLATSQWLSSNGNKVTIPIMNSRRTGHHGESIMEPLTQGSTGSILTLKRTHPFPPLILWQLKRTNPREQ